jgi:hypothetical protein
MSKIYLHLLVKLVKSSSLNRKISKIYFHSTVKLVKYTSYKMGKIYLT